MENQRPGDCEGSRMGSRCTIPHLSGVREQQVGMLELVEIAGLGLGVIEGGWGCRCFWLKCLRDWSSYS